MDEWDSKHNVFLKRSSRAKSGYKYVSFHSRKKVGKWFVQHSLLKKSGFHTARDAACTLAIALSSQKNATDMTDMRTQWTTKANVSFPLNEGSLFGARVSIFRNYAKTPTLAVFKSWSPVNKTFGVVYDDRPKNVYNQSLKTLRWTRIDWEGDIFQTSHLRPLCPECAHPLGEGLQEWTKCNVCNFCEPGCMSHVVLNRVNNGDPFRKPRVDYTEF